MSIRTTQPLIIGLLLAQLAAVSGCQATKSMFSGGNQDIARTNPQTQQPQLMPGVPPSEPAAALTKNQKMNVQMALARSLEKQHKQQDAFGIYQEIARRDKTNAEAWHRMAVISDMDGKPEKATEYYKLALENSPKNADIYCDRGYSQYLQRRWAESEQSYRKAIELKPDLTRAYNNLGMLMARTGRQNEALMAFHHAGNDESEARCNMALAMMLEKHWDEAENECRTALQNKHTSPKTREKLDHFSNLIAQARPGGNKGNMSASTGMSANTGMSSPSINRPAMAAQPENIAYRAPAPAQSIAQSVPMQSMPAPAIAPANIPAPANYQTAANAPAPYNPPAIYNPPAYNPPAMTRAPALTPAEALTPAPAQQASYVLPAMPPAAGNMTAAGNMPAGDRYADYRYTATPTAQVQSIPQSLPEQIGPAPAAPMMASSYTMEEPARIVRLPIPYGIGAAAIEGRPPVAAPAPIVPQPRPITFAPPALPGENASQQRYIAPSNTPPTGAPPTGAATTDTSSTDQTSLVLRISPP